ncbi:MAG: M20 family metallopeptidase [Nanoarchaeota archaeon]|nr:M20 family metallopeptidase [Nanoarchaeota archaeon]
MSKKSVEEILFDLIRIDSSVNEFEISNYIIKFLKKRTDFKIETQIVEDNRVNVIASKGNPKLVLAGHTDTVGFTINEWKKEGLHPLKPVEKEGKVFGRGAVDMKAGLAVMLKIAEEFKGNDLMLLFDVDEETNFKGIKKFVDEYKNKSDFNPELFVFLEPTNLTISNKHKGLYECRYLIRGKSEHSSRPNLGNNPAKLLLDLFNLENEMLRKEFYDSESDLHPTINFGNGQFGLEINNVNSSDKSLCLYDRDKLNSVPNIFEFCFDIRTTKQFEDNNGIEFVSKFIEDSVSNRCLKIINKEVVNNKPSLFVSREKLNGIYSIVASVLDNVKFTVFRAGYSEAGIIKDKLCFDSIIIGPSPLEKAHNTLEFVFVDSLNKTYEIVKKIVLSYCN